MNFTKYVAALALFATAAFAADNSESGENGTKAEVKIDKNQLKTAMNNCIESKKYDEYVQCMKKNEIKDDAVIKGAFAKNPKDVKVKAIELTDDELNAIIATPASSSSFFTTTNVVILSVGSVALIGAVAGGIYMVTRKSSETDL